MLKAVLLDMDGTLLDSESCHLEAVKRLLKELGIDASSDSIDYGAGTDYETIWEENIRRFDIGLPLEELLKRQINVTVRYFNEAKIYEARGVTAFLKLMKEKGMLLAVGSSSPVRVVDTILKKLCIDEYMDYICGAEDVELVKPAPDVFVHIAEYLGVEPAECIVIEDSPVGIEAAKNAGMKCIAVSHNESVNDVALQADKIVFSFIELDYASLFSLLS